MGIGVGSGLKRATTCILFFLCCCLEGEEVRLAPVKVEEIIPYYEGEGVYPIELLGSALNKAIYRNFSVVLDLKKEICKASCYVVYPEEGKKVLLRNVKGYIEAEIIETQCSCLDKRFIELRVSLKIYIDNLGYAGLYSSSTPFIFDFSQ